MAKKPAVKKTPTEKKPSLDIKDEMLYSDYKVFDWLEQQTPEMAKTFSPLIAMKWQSVVQNPHYNDPPGYQTVTREVMEDYILNVNDLVNIDFWALSKHPELQWMLMCAAGTGVPYKHGWVPLASKRKSVSKVNQIFLTLHPQLNDEELALLRSKFDTDSFKQLLRDMGMSDADIKPLVEEFKKTNG